MPIIIIINNLLLKRPNILLKPKNSEFKFPKWMHTRLLIENSDGLSFRFNLSPVFREVARVFVNRLSTATDNRTTLKLYDYLSETYINPCTYPPEIWTKILQLAYWKVYFHHCSVFVVIFALLQLKHETYLFTKRFKTRQTQWNWNA